MKIFLRELKAHRNSLIFWSIGMFALIGSSMAKYDAYSQTGQSMDSLIKQFPKMVQVVFGINGFDLSTVQGFFGIIFMYIALMGTIHAVLLGVDLISKEERDRTSEFLYVKPVSRAAAITAKLLAGLSNLIVLNLVTFFSSIYLVSSLGKGASIAHDALILMAGLFFLQLIFFALGAAIGAISKKPKATSGWATSILLVTFFLSILVNMSDKLNFLKYLTPFKYFDARDLLNSGRLDVGFIALSLCVIAVGIILTYSFYNKRDLNI